MSCSSNRGLSGNSGKGIISLITIVLSKKRETDFFFLKENHENSNSPHEELDRYRNRSVTTESQEK